jgi:hypothetical protein
MKLFLVRDQEVGGSNPLAPTNFPTVRVSRNHAALAERPATPRTLRKTGEECGTLRSFPHSVAKIRCDIIRLRLEVKLEKLCNAEGSAAHLLDLFG